MTADNSYSQETFEHAMIALAASAAMTACSGEVDFVDSTDYAFEPEIVEEGGQFVIPLLIPEEIETGDGRKFEKGALSHRDLPLPLLWQVQTGDGHDGSVLVGRIDTVEKLENGFGNARGVFDTGVWGREAERLVRGGFLRGVSADLDQFEAAVEDEDMSELAAGDDEDTDTREKIKNDKITVTRGRVMAATLVPKPAFAECGISMASDVDPDAEFELADGIYEEDIDDPDMLYATITASAAPVKPPVAWFDNPKLKGPSPITVEDDGRVYGHIASWQTSHIGMGNRSIKPPHSSSGYRYFMTGVLRTAEGQDVTVGQLTLAGGHAPLDQNAQAAVKHYDDTASAVADVYVGEDAYGIWVAGALRPSVTPEQVRVLRASAPSGDWRPINNRLELVAVCQVNVPGFPVARTLVAGGQVTALVAAGAHDIAMLREDPVRKLEDRLKLLESTELAKMRDLAVQRMSPSVQMRREALLAAAEAARQRMAPSQEARAALSAERDAIRERFLALKISAERNFDPKQPRDSEGKWRLILGRISDAVSGISGGSEAISQLEEAADAAEAGDLARADEIATEVRGRLEGLEEAARDSNLTQELISAIDQVDEAINEPAGGTPPVEAETPQSKMNPAVEEPLPEIDPTEPTAAEAKAIMDGEGIAVDDDENTELDAGTQPSTGDPRLDQIIGDLIAANMNADLPPMLAQLVSWAVNQIVAKVDPTQAIRNAPNQIARQLEGKQFRDVGELADWIHELIRRAVSPI